MCVYSYSEESFGYLIAFKSGKIGLYDKEVINLIRDNAAYENYMPYKLKKIRIGKKFYLNSPLIIWLEITRRCNLECKHCFVEGGEARENELSIKDIYNLLDEFRRKNVFCLVITGGEPLLHEEILSIVQYAKKLNIIVALVTNGVLLTEEIIKQLPTDNFRLTISIDGLQSHSKLRGGIKAEKLLNKLLILKRYRVPCNVSITMNRENLIELEQLFLWLIKKEIPFHTIPFTPIGRGASYKYLQLKEEDVQFAAKLWQIEFKHDQEMSKKIGLTFSTFYDYALNLVYMTRQCKGGKYLAYITSNGDVYPCTTCAGTKMFSAGNIRQLPFSTIWDYSFEDFRKITWDNYKVCNWCSLSSSEYVCTNRCPPLSKLYNGSIFACGATPYDRNSLALRTKMLNALKC